MNDGALAFGERCGSGGLFRPTPVGYARGALAPVATDTIFASEQIVAPFATDTGLRLLRLSDIVNSAILVGFVEHLTGNAVLDLGIGGTPSGQMPLTSIKQSAPPWPRLSRSVHGRSVEAA
ncbi:hypothetical protein ACU4GR_01610 [Methylobacterium oryzae CBMB20]